MNHVRFIRRVMSVVAAAGTSFLGFVLFAPPAFARVMPAPGGVASGRSPQPAPTVVHNIVTGGMAGWQIALIALAAALLTAILAVFTDRARGSRRNVRVSAA
jgi:hypothetical protein